MVDNSKVCKNCEENLSDDKKIFCDSSCSASYNNKIRKKKNHGNCLECNNSLNRTKRKFCSNNCQGVFRKKKTFAAIEKGDLTFYEERYKDYLIHKNGAKCMDCGWCQVNKFTGNIPIQLEHVDGNSENNKLENLKLLCPNCHSLTKTWGGANKGNGRKSRREKRKQK